MSRRTTSRPRSPCSARSLLSRDAIGAVSEQGLRPDDFYKPGHQHIFDAVRALYATGAPADTITVADELRRAGLLEQVGGAEALHALQNATPAISNAAHYARIVQDTALLRRLIHVAGDIAEMAYGEPDDVTKAVDEAESKVFKVAEDRVTDSTQLLSESIKGVMDRLEETFARGDTITGTATGLPRPRRAAVGPAALDAEHRRGPPGHGQDGVRARAWPPTSPRPPAGRSSCSRWRWATTS